MPAKHIEFHEFLVIIPIVLRCNVAMHTLPRLQSKTGKKTGNVTESLAEDEKIFFEYIHGDCEETIADLVPLNCGVASTSAATAEDNEVAKLLPSSINVSFSQMEQSASPSPLTLMGSISLASRSVTPFP